MKRYLICLCGVAVMTLQAAGTLPLYNAFLQSDLDGDGQSVTNVAKLGLNIQPTFTLDLGVTNTATSATTYGGRILTYAVPSGASAANGVGLVAQNRFYGSYDNTGYSRGIEGYSVHLGTGTLAQQAGGYFNAQSVGGGHSTSMYGLWSQLSLSGGSTATTGYGLIISTLPTAITHKYAINQQGPNDTNYLAGLVYAARTTDAVGYFTGAGLLSELTYGDKISQTAGVLSLDAEVINNGGLFAATANVQAANTVSATDLLGGTGVGSVTIAADRLEAGTTLRITAAGVYSTAASTTDAAIALKLGSVTLASVSSQTITVSMTDQLWTAEIWITCRTAGATGTVMAQGTMTLAESGSLAAPKIIPLSNTATDTVDTTAAADLALEWTWTTADAANDIRLTTAVVEIMR